MKFCQKCGKQLMDEAVICPSCGCPVNTNHTANVQPSTTAIRLENGETSSLATCALVFSFLMPIVGLILGIIGCAKYKTENLKNRCIAAIPISIVVWIISFAILSGGF